MDLQKFFVLLCIVSFFKNNNYVTVIILPMVFIISGVSKPGTVLFLKWLVFVDVLLDAN